MKEIVCIQISLTDSNVTLPHIMSFFFFFWLYEVLKLWDGVVVLKELIFTVSTLGGEVVVLKEVILTVSTLGRSGGLERIDFNSFYFGGRKWWS